MASGDVLIFSLQCSLNLCIHVLVSSDPLIVSLCFCTTTSHSGMSIQLLLVCIYSSESHTLAWESFWSTIFLCLPERFVVANFWKAGSGSEEINNSLTSVGWYGANVRMLYLHTQRFPSDLLFGLFNKQFDSFSTGLIFCGQAAKPDLISFCVMQYIYFNPKPST